MVAIEAALAGLGSSHTAHASAAAALMSVHCGHAHSAKAASRCRFGGISAISAGGGALVEGSAAAADDDVDADRADAGAATGATTPLPDARLPSDAPGSPVTGRVPSRLAVATVRVACAAGGSYAVGSSAAIGAGSASGWDSRAGSTAGEAQAPPAEEAAPSEGSSPSASLRTGRHRAAAASRTSRWAPVAE